ncbi:MAG: hypothetical protein ACRC6T_17440 [Sarcina sp.]
MKKILLISILTATTLSGLFFYNSLNSKDSNITVPIQTISADKNFDGDTSTVNKDSNFSIPLVAFNKNGEVPINLDASTMLDLSTFDILKENNTFTLEVNKEKSNKILDYHKFSKEMAFAYKASLDNSLKLFESLPSLEKERVYDIYKEYSQNEKILTGIQVSTLDIPQVRMSFGYDKKGKPWVQGDIQFDKNTDFEKINTLVLATNNGILQGQNDAINLLTTDNQIICYGGGKTHSTPNLIAYTFSKPDTDIKKFSIGSYIRKNGQKPSYISIGSEYTGSKKELSNITLNKNQIDFGDSKISNALGSYTEIYL